MHNDVPTAAPIVFSDEERGLQVLVEDDGIAAYALLIDVASKRPVSGVWLYNRANCDNSAPDPTPDKKQQIRNPPEFVIDEPFAPITSERDVTVNFCGGGDLVPYVQLFIRSKLHAHLEVGAHTGWCVLAKKSGPFAKAMVVTPVDADTSDVHLCDYDD